MQNSSMERFTISLDDRLAQQFDETITVGNQPQSIGHRQKVPDRPAVLPMRNAAEQCRLTMPGQDCPIAQRTVSEGEGKGRAHND